MTIVLISHTADLNGAERSLLELARGLAARELACQVIVPAEGPLATRLRRAGIPVTILALPRPRRHPGYLLLFLVLWLPTVLRLAVWLRRQGSTAVYNNTIDGLYGPFAARLAGVPCVWHVREVKPKQAWARRFFTALLTRLPKHTVFNTLATLHAYAPAPRADWSVIYNGVEFQESAPPVEPVGDRPVVAGFAGQMAAHKRPDRFLEALAETGTGTPELYGIMVGDGPLLSEVRALAGRLGLHGRVDIRGFVPDMAGFYRDIDLLVLTSEHEPFGRVLIEAMAAGRPTVAAAVDGVPEVVVEGETGFLVPAGDIQAYAQCMARLARDPALRRSMGAAGRARVRDHFTLERYIEQLAALLCTPEGVADARHA